MQQSNARKAFKRLSENFVMVNTADDDEPFEEEYRPDGKYIPRLLFLDKNGDPLLQVKNKKAEYKNYAYYYSSPADILNSMKEVLAHFGIEVNEPTKGDGLKPKKPPVNKPKGDSPEGPQHTKPKKPTETKEKPDSQVEQAPTEAGDEKTKKEDKKSASSKKRARSQNCNREESLAEDVQECQDMRNTIFKTITKLEEQADIINPTIVTKTNATSKSDILAYTTEEADKLHSLTCTIVYPLTSLSLDVHPDAQAQEKSHRHSVNQLEPDLASSIFETPAPRKLANPAVVAAIANPNSKNPLERTTTMPNTHNLDAGSAGPRGRRAAGLQPAVKFSEYDGLNADFNIDAQESIVQKEESVLPTSIQTQPKVQVLSNSDVAEVVALEADHDEESSDNGSEKTSESEISFQKAHDTHKQLLAKLDKEESVLSSVSTTSTQASTIASTVVNQNTTVDSVQNNNPAALTNAAQISETAKVQSVSENSTDAVIAAQPPVPILGLNRTSDPSSALTTVQSTMTTTTASSTESLLEIHDIVEDSKGAEPILVDDTATFAPTTFLDRSVQKRRSLVSNFVRPIVPHQQLATRVKRADSKQIRTIHIRDIETSSSRPTTTTTKARNQYRIIESGEREVVDRSHLKIGLKLVPSTIAPPTTIIPKKLLETTNRQISDAENAVVGTEGGSDKDIGLERVGSSASSDASIGTRQPDMAVQNPPQLQLNHYYIGRRKFVVKSVPADWWHQQQQQLAMAQQQEASLRQQALQQQQLAMAQQPQQFLPPLISNVRSGSVSTGQRVDSDIAPRAQTGAPEQTGTASSSKLERVKNEQLNVVRIFDSSSTTQQGFTSIPSTSTTPMFRNAFTDVREDIAATPLPNIIITPKPETHEHVKVTDGELYDEVGETEPKPATKMVGDQRRSRRFSAVPLPNSSEDNAPLRLVKLPKDNSRRRDQPAEDFGLNRDSPYSKPANEAFIKKVVGSAHGN
uniref:Uncharacterized protein n=1 Tax=Ditylenchus dipsaci TaxID=166011 RepID=A0A915D1C8_9BILA